MISFQLVFFLLPEGLLPQDEDLEIPINNTEFVNSLALFYLKMQAKLFLPACNIQMLLGNLNDIHVARESYKSSKVSRKLKELNISDEDTLRSSWLSFKM